MLDINHLISYGASYRKAKADEVIFMEGSEAVYYYQLISGSVRWINISDDGREFIQAIVGAGESFGELPLFDNKAYAATAITEEECLMIRLPVASFRQLLYENPQVHFEFTQLMVERLRYKFMMEKENAFYDPEHIIFTLLRYFKKNQRHICPVSSKVKLTRQQLANMTGLRVETVIRSIRQLHLKGEIAIEHGKVYC